MLVVLRGVSMRRARSYVFRNGCVTNRKAVMYASVVLHLGSRDRMPNKITNRLLRSRIFKAHAAVNLQRALLAGIPSKHVNR